MIMYAALMGGQEHGSAGLTGRRLFLESHVVSALAVPVEHRFVLSGKADRVARPGPGQGTPARQGGRGAQGGCACGLAG
jgi:hypothetical protein